MKIHPPLLKAVASWTLHALSVYPDNVAVLLAALHRDGCDAARSYRFGTGRAHTDADATEQSPALIDSHCGAFANYCEARGLVPVDCAKAILDATPGMLAWWVEQLEAVGEAEPSPAPEAVPVVDDRSTLEVMTASDDQLTCTWYGAGEVAKYPPDGTAVEITTPRGDVFEVTTEWDTTGWRTDIVVPAGSTARTIWRDGRTFVDESEDDE